MKWNIAKPFILLFTIYFCRWLLMRGEAKEEEAWNERREEIEGREIAAVQFRATVKMGIRRKTMIIGQVYEYLRMRGRIWSHFVDQEGNVEVKVVEMKDNITHQRKLYLIIKFMISDSYQLEYKNRDVENMNKRGSQNWAILSLNLEPNEFVSTSTIFEMKIMNKISRIEIDNRTLLVESTVKIDLKYNSNNRSINEVSKIHVYIPKPL